jgi:hypothetical protein
MMLLVALFGRMNGHALSEDFWHRLEHMLEFIAAIMDVQGHVPMIGDADDGVMVRLSPASEFDMFRSLLATGAVLFARPDFALKAVKFDDKSRWLLGDEAGDRFAVLREPPVERCTQAVGSRTPSKQFREGGYYVLGYQVGTSQEVRLVVDSGALGYLAIAAHGHADALAFTLSVRGHEVLIDPGTYAYHTQAKWRNYFRGTSAHNTVRVDALDQSVSGGAFMWLHHANARCEGFTASDTHDYFVGSHDGYLRLRAPLLHRREIRFDKAREVIRVIDMLESTGEHEIEIFWHFAQDCRVELCGRTVHASSAASRVALSMPDCEWEPIVVVGRDDPPLGWLSSRFDVKVPTATVVWRGLTRGNASLVSILEIT